MSVVFNEAFPSGRAFIMKITEIQNPNVTSSGNIKVIKIYQ